MTQTNKWIEDVLDFHEKFGLPVSHTPTGVGVRERELRQNVIREEMHELLFELEFDEVDHAKLAKEIADVIYVALGTAITYGIDMGPVWALVHESNMAKEGGGAREDGKILKPEGWKEPAVFQEIIRQSRLATHE